MDYLKPTENGFLLLVYVQPGASKTGWAGLFGDPGRLKLKISAPPVDGEANGAVVEFIAKYLGLKKSEVELLRGEKSRLKDVRLFVSKEKQRDLEAALISAGTSSIR